MSAAAAALASERVADPFGAAGDPALPTVARTLVPAVAERELRRTVPEAGALEVDAIRVVHHKPGRRCLIEYDVRTPADGAVTLIGKVRRQRTGEIDFGLTRALWEAGFDGRSADGVSVPEPLGVSLELQMWLQRKVPGPPATALLDGPGGVALAGRIAEAARKVHVAGVAPWRVHGMADELRVLHDVLGRLAAARPAWALRIARLLAACERLGASVPEPRPCGVHRDFYGEQVLVDGDRLWLIDFDLYCLGDPALDAGNFIGHITEQALREHGDAAALADREAALEERFAALAGDEVRARVRAYVTLTLARHVCLSLERLGDVAFTTRLFELCEERLAIAVPGRGAMTWAGGGARGALTAAGAGGAAR
jgi:hypothetical protein